ncbi:ParB/RepB/Spo0J family partition protein [Isoptericola sp. BMS4]|uniref:ParB/RepB/Spo0J family partition protein n=1 Tax=Isoptericola sp. BMS4 TaxID=2527875 RepID=UPI001423FE10|nr:ParB/RepB/Spo0J family partition protein [Isoptericola sp. BMS4]
MSQKKRGLGRGLGALIPSSPESDRPVDVFFSGSGEQGGSGSSAAVTGAVGDEARDSEDAAGRTKGRSASWDSAIAGGRLRIRSQAVGGSRPDGSEGTSTATLEQADDRAPLERDREGEGATAAVPAPVDGPVDLESLGVTTRIATTVSDGDDAVTALPGDDTETAGVAGAETTSLTSGHGAEPSEDTVSSEETPTPDRDDADAVSRETELVPVPGARFAEVPVESIRPNTRQPRTVFDEGDLDELVDSVSQIGVLQPIVVRPDRSVEGQYELIMGERRWRASQVAGLETIPAIVRETDDSDMLRDALLENLHRAALNPLEEAAAYRQLLDDFDCTHEELASRIARSRPQISNTLRLLRLPPLVQRRVAAGVLSAGHARALLGLTDGAEIERLAQRIVSEGLSVRATEEIVTLLVNGDGTAAPRRSPRAGQRSEAMDELATRLSDHFETRVKVNIGKNKGRLTVEFASVEDLNRILEVMAPEDPGLLRP